MAVPDEVARRRNLGALLFSLVFPTLVTVLYFIVLDKQSAPLQQGAFGLGKLLQFAFPVAWVAWIQRGKLGRSSPRAGDLAAGAALGLVLLAAALTLYFLMLKPSGAFGTAADKIREKVAGLGA